MRVSKAVIALASFGCKATRPGWPECFKSPVIEDIYLPAAPEQAHRILRLDQIHAQISGNKWFKLRPYLERAKLHDLGILSCGGAWSNHLYALAAACQLFGLPGKVLLRGEWPEQPSPVLQFVKQCQLEVIPISRSDYRLLRDQNHWQALQAQYPDSICVPEGGAGEAGVQGAADIDNWIPDTIRTIALACGTATTLAGLLRAAKAHQSLLGVAVLKDADFLRDQVKSVNQGHPIQAQWELETAYHCGGYAKVSSPLRLFMSEFQALNPQIPIEPIYTGKMLYALNQRCLSGETFEDLLVIHTGGAYRWNQDL